MKKIQSKLVKQILFGLAGLSLVGLGVLALPLLAKALSFEDVGASLGLGSADLKETIINVIKWVLGIVGLVAVIVMIYGGFVWMMARGNQQQIDKAKKILINGAIGLVIILVAWAIVLFIQRFITQTTGGSASAAGCVVGNPTPTCTLCDENGDGDPTNGLGTLIPDPTCVNPTTQQYRAQWLDPNDQQTNVSLCATVQARYGGLTPTAANPNANDIDPASAFSVADSGGTNVNGVVGFSGEYVAFTPANDYAPNTVYQVDATGIRSVPPGSIPSSFPLAGAWSFTTGTTSDSTPPRVALDTSNNPLTSPGHNETIQCLSPVIEVQFTEPLHVLSALNPANLKLERVDGQPVTAQISNVSMPTPSVISVTLNQPLVRNIRYRVTLSAETDNTLNNGKYSGYKDTCLNALDCEGGIGSCNGDGNSDDDPADNYIWEFQTADTDTVDCTPVITGLSAAPHHYGNIANQQRVTITGSNFGISPIIRFAGNVIADQNTGSTSLCFNNLFLPNQASSVACVQSVNATHTQIQSIIPAGPLGPTPNGAVDGPITVEVGNKSSPASAAAIDIQNPRIERVYPQEGKPGRLVTITGSGFGTNGTIRFRRPTSTDVAASVPTCATSGWTDNQIIVQVPEGLNINDIAYIQVDSDRFADVRGMSNLARFDVKDIDAPSLCSINPTSSNNGNASLNATGDGFSGTISTVYNTIAGTASNVAADGKSLTSTPNATLTNGTYNFSVNVNGRYSNPLQYRIPRDPVPQVVQDAACNPSASVLPSPNPYPNSTEVCRNIILSARFNINMQTSGANSLTDATRINFRRCDNSPDFGCTSPQVLNGTLTAPLPSLVKFAPAGNLDPGYWYEGRIQAGILSAAGVALPSDFVWHFKVRNSTEICTVDAVVVTPGRAGPLYTGQSQAFVAGGYTNTCSELTGTAGFSWTTSDASLSGPINLSTSTRPNDTNTAIVPAGTNSGTVDLRATLDNKTGVGQLVVDRFYCETNNDCQTRFNSYGLQCTGSYCDNNAKRCGPWINEIEFPTGTAGNLVNVKGCFFGDSKGDGEVYFNNPGIGQYAGSFQMCGPQNWTNDIIRVQAQPNSAPSASVWNVAVRTSSQYGGLTSNGNLTYTISNQCQSESGGTVTPPGTGVPILCSITPSAVKENSRVTFYGNLFNAVPGQGQTFFSQTGQPNFPASGQGGGTFTTTQVSNATVPVGTGTPTTSPNPQATVGTLAAGGYCIATPTPIQISCSANSDCLSSGCCINNTCQSTALLCTDNLIQSITPPAGNLTCTNQIFSVLFARRMQFNTLNTNTVRLINVSTNTEVPIDLRGINTPTQTQVDIMPRSLLAVGQYRIRIVGGANGVVAEDGKFLSADYFFPSAPAVYNVAVTAVVCKVDHVKIFRNGLARTSDTFFCSTSGCTVGGFVDDDEAAVAQNNHLFWAEAYDKDDHLLAVTAQAWTEADTNPTGSASNTFRGGDTGGLCAGAATNPGEGYCATSLNVPSGTESLSVKLTGAYGAGEGTASISINSFLCANPWPYAPNPWPFQDPNFGAGDLRSHNFETSFCGDNLGDYSLSNPTRGFNLNDPGLKKEYFLFVQEKDSNGVFRSTGDAIGVRIYENPNLLSPERWYKRQLNKNFSGSKTTIDGYPAIREGRTVYITGLTEFSSTPSPGLLSYVYVISHTDKAQPATTQIFEEFLKNLRFNQGVSYSLSRPLDQNEKTAIRRDVKRLQGYWEIVYAMEAYKTSKGFYPKLETGSFLKGISTDKWPSWQNELGRELNLSMPKDEVGWNSTLVQQYCPTPGYDPATCWNETLKRFTYPTDGVLPPKSQGSLYAIDSGGSPILLGTLEFPGTNGLVYAMPLALQYIQPPSLQNISGINPCAGTNGSSCAGFNFRVSGGNFASINSETQALALDTVAPTVSIDGPAAGNISGTVDASATAADTGGSGLAQVEFTVRSGTNVLQQGIVTSPSRDGKYHWSWNTRSLVNGSYVLRAIATDRAGNVSPNADRNYIINNPPGDFTAPSITLINPNSNTTWGAGAKNLSASATDNVGIAKIEFYLGTSKLAQAPDPACTSGCGNYTANVTVPAEVIAGFSDGVYTYSAVAYDTSGNTAIRQLQINLNRSSDNTAPTVQILTPSNGSSISGSYVDVNVNATDGGSGIDRVEFLVDGSLTPDFIDYTAPFLYAWPTGSYADGSSHNVRANGYDRAGNSATAVSNVTYSTATGPDTTRPIISNFLPADGTNVSNIVTISADLSDNAGLLRAQLRINGQDVALTGGALSQISSTSWRLNYAWNTLPENLGSNTISLILYDTSNNIASINRTVNVTNQISINFTSPRDNDTVQDNPTVLIRTQTLSSCSPAGVQAVDLYLDNLTTPFHSMNPAAGDCSVATNICTYNWTSAATTSDGRHTLYAIARDSAGCRGGDRISIVVSNQINDVTQPIIDSVDFSPALRSGRYTRTAETITVTAHDNTGGSGLATIEILVDSALVQTCSTSPCQVNWVPSVNKDYIVRVVVRDVANNGATQTLVVGYDNLAPTVVWQSPADGTSINVPPDTTLSAIADDPLSSGYASGIAAVFFFRNFFPLVPVGTAGSGGLYTWTGQPGYGNNLPFFARTEDRAGNPGQSGTVYLNILPPADTTPPPLPTLNFTPPLVNVSGTMYARGTLSVDATGNDPDSGISRIEILRDGTVVQTCNGPTAAGVPLTCNWTWNTTTAVNGQIYNISAIAYNTTGVPPNDASGPTVQAIRIDNSTIGLFWLPTNGQVVTGTITIDINTFDNLSGVASVTLYRNNPANTLLGNAALASCTLGNCHWTLSWNTGTVTPGPYQLLAEVRDRVGNLYSATVNVTVQ
ncbi:hypothetical protein C4546_04515 [Candidatus Parcubacteria bacterium]|jgi:hypothetical protein|nr:MAG: hypothetical protein C4546_04515 [Candidatus Parcubacteria bacterium]